tara:strand:+ start:20 stop:613 length:594 start_codon:yes stop_codon:yes gene_type:complete
MVVAVVLVKKPLSFLLSYAKKQERGERIKIDFLKKGVWVRKFNFFLFTIFFLIIGCKDESTIHSAHIETNGFWLKDTPIKASLEISDSPVDIYLILKLDEDYPFSNIYLLSNLENSNLKVTGTISYRFDDSENKNLLSKQTRIKTFKIPIHKNINVSGETLVEVSHAVRYIDSLGAVMKLQGILDVGILVNKSNEKI